MEYALIALILAAAAWVLVRRAIKTLRAKDAPTCGCGGSCGLGCPGCPTSHAVGPCDDAPPGSRAPGDIEDQAPRPGE